MTLRKALTARKHERQTKEKTSELGRVVPPKNKTFLSDNKSFQNANNLKTAELSQIKQPLPDVNWFDVLKKSPEQENRKQAVRALNKVSGTGTINALLDTILNDESKEVRLEAIEALAKIGDVKSLEGLLKGIKEEKDVDVRKRIAWAYSQIKYRNSGKK